MHDAARSLDVDTVVVDVDELPRPSSPRTRTDGALTMQVMQNGEWHRRTPDLAMTACEQPIHSQFSPLRREELADPLCTTCFTPYECRRAREKTRADLVGT